MYEVDYYRSLDGSCPVEAFLDHLAPKMKAKVFGRMELLEEYGPQLAFLFSRHLEDGIFEPRVVQGSNAARVLYFFVAGKRAILTHGFMKKTQKTPRKEIERAKAIRSDWRRLNE